MSKWTKRIPKTAGLYWMKWENSVNPVFIRWLEINKKEGCLYLAITLGSSFMKHTRIKNGYGNAMFGAKIKKPRAVLA